MGLMGQMNLKEIAQMALVQNQAPNILSHSRHVWPAQRSAVEVAEEIACQLGSSFRTLKSLCVFVSMQFPILIPGICRQHLQLTGQMLSRESIVAAIVMNQPFLAF